MSIEHSIVEHCAPTLATLKAASLFSIVSPCWAELDRQVGALRGELSAKGISLRVLRVDERRALCYLYRADMLGAILADPAAKAFLAAQGYAPADTESAVDVLCRRILENPGFPHEIGLFLGYPLSDVVAFIEHGGRGGVCCGCWKCYSDAETAQRTFARYEKCTRVYRRLYRAGRPFSRLAVAR